jgi:hypothetical protein
MNKTLQTLSLLLGLGSILLSTNAKAQSFTITDLLGDTINNSEVIVTGLSTDATLSFPAYVTNSASDTNVTRCRRRIIEQVASTSNYFCWGICYGPSVNVGNQSVVLGPGDTYENFHAYFTPDSTSGISRIMYVFYDNNNPADSAYFTVKFEVSPNLAGIGEIANEIPVKLYPTSASQNITIEMEKKFSVMIAVYDMNGKQHHLTSSLGNSLLNLDVSGLSQGMYQVMITDTQSGKRSVKRFIRQ